MSYYGTLANVAATVGVTALLFFTCPYSASLIDSLRTVSVDAVVAIARGLPGGTLD